MVFMVLGLVTFFVISSKLGGLQAASNAVLEKNPRKMMRDVTEGEIEGFEKARAGWETLAVFNWVDRAAAVVEGYLAGQAGADPDRGHTVAVQLVPPAVLVGFRAAGHGDPGDAIRVANRRLRRG